MIRAIVAGLLCAAIATGGCAATGPGARVAPDPQVGLIDHVVLADYLLRLPAGSRIRVERPDGTLLRGTLMSASAQSIVMQENTRVPETAVELPLDQLARVTLDGGESRIARTVAVGVASGAGTALGVFLLLLALFAD